MEIRMSIHITMFRHLMALLLAASIAIPPAAFAQAHAPGPAASASPQQVQLLFVQNSTGVAVDEAKGTLRLKNVSPSTLFFTDRPVRMAGHYHTKGEFLKLWSEGPDSFAKNPPNATLSIVEPGQPDLQNAVVVLRNPRMAGNDLIYDIKLVEGKLPKASNAAVLFIDVLGIWRRNIRRVAVIGTAAAVTTAAVVTAGAVAASAAKPQTVTVHVAAPPPKPAPQPTATEKLEQLKNLQSEGLITQAQYQKASQEVLNEMVK
jgi:hypothetical protein